MNQDVYSGSILDISNRKEVREKIHKIYSKEFDFLYKLSNEMTEIEEALSGNVTNAGAEAFILSNFVITHNTFMSSIILFELGMQDDALSLFRSIYERIVYIKCAMKDDTYYKILLNEIYEELHKYKIIKKYPDEFRTVSIAKLTKLEKQCLDEGQRLLDKIHGPGVKEYKGKNRYLLSELANIVGLKQQFDYMYPVLCTKVHSDVGAVFSKIKEDDNGVYLDIYPQHNDNHQFTQTIANLMLILIESICKFFKLSDEKIQTLSTEENEIWKDII